MRERTDPDQVPCRVVSELGVVWQSLKERDSMFEHEGSVVERVTCRHSPDALEDRRCIPTEVARRCRVEDVCEEAALV